MLESCGSGLFAGNSAGSNVNACKADVSTAVVLIFAQVIRYKQHQDSSEPG